MRHRQSVELHATCFGDDRTGWVVAVREAAPKYERRRPEQGALYRVVRDNLRTLDDAIEHGFAAPLP
ncbi:MAG: hypothetical protein JW751_13860, partial [Polyangiaceae bacterium]|nr:hypothetical protein [Polyangiaceae bacterium]